MHTQVRLYNNTDGTPACFQDFDTESKPPGRYCTGHTNATARALQVQAADINQSTPDPYMQCASSCIALGLAGTAGIESGYQCWCSNYTGTRGPPATPSQCSTPCRMKSPGSYVCGGYCRMTEFRIECSSPTPPPPPPKGYACLNGACLMVENVPGVPLDVCQEICLQKYECVNGTCVVNKCSTGVPLPVCKDVCRGAPFIDKE